MTLRSRIRKWSRLHSSHQIYMYKFDRSSESDSGNRKDVVSFGWLSLFDPENGMSLMADTWHVWGTLKIQEAVQIYDKLEQDNHRAIDVRVHGLKSCGPPFRFSWFFDLRNSSLLSHLFHWIDQRASGNPRFTNFQSIFNSFPSPS